MRTEVKSSKTPKNSKGTATVKGTFLYRCHLSATHPIYTSVRNNRTIEKFCEKFAELKTLSNFVMPKSYIAYSRHIQITLYRRVPAILLLRAVVALWREKGARLLSLYTYQLTCF